MQAQTTDWTSPEHLFAALARGLAWAVHPAHGTEQWRSTEPTGWRVGQSDQAFLTSPHAGEILSREGIAVIDYRPLQRVWNA